MVEVRARVMLAGMAVAFGVDRFLGEFVHGATEMKFTVRGKRRAALRELRGNDAVEHVDAAVHGFENIDRCAHAHQVTGQMGGQLFSHHTGELVAFVMRFADREAADGNAVERQLAQKRGALFPEVTVTGTLYDAEKRLRRISTRRQRAFGPAVGELHSRLGLIVRSGGRNALIEHHHDIAPDHLLHFDAGFRREQVRVAVHITLEARPFFLHGSGTGKGENLKPTGVSQHRPIPVHEAMDTAEFLENFRAGAEQQMIGVGEQHAGARRFQGIDRLALDCGLGTDRHEDGCLDLTVQGGEFRRPGLGAAGGFFEGEVQTGHRLIGQETGLALQ